MTKSDYLKNAQPVTVTVGTVTDVAYPRKFKDDSTPESDRSVGYYFGGKVPLAPGSKSIKAVFNGTELQTYPSEPKPDKKPNIHAGGTIVVNGIPHGVSFNATDLGDGRANVSWSVYAKGSKAWEPGQAAAAPPKPAPAAKPKAATADIAPPAPAGPRSLTAAEAAKQFQAASGMDPDSIGPKKFEKMTNAWANRQNITIVG